MPRFRYVDSPRRKVNEDRIVGNQESWEEEGSEIGYKVSEYAWIGEKREGQNPRTGERGSRVLNEGIHVWHHRRNERYKIR